MASTLDWRKHDRAITAFVREVTNFYLRTEASTGTRLREDQGILLRNNFATPPNIHKLLSYLTIVTVMVQHTIDEMSRPPETIQAVQKELDAWMIRLAEYRVQTELANQRNPTYSGDEDPEFWDRVTEPLLLGIYPGEAQQRVLDAVTPIMLAWQIEVAKDAYNEAATSFWKDLKESVGDVLSTGTSWLAGLALLAVLGLGLGYGYGKGRS